MDDPVKFQFDGKVGKSQTGDKTTLTRGHGACMRHGMIDLAQSFLEAKHRKHGFVGSISVTNEGHPVYVLSIDADGEISRDS